MLLSSDSAQKAPLTALCPAPGAPVGRAGSWGCDRAWGLGQASDGQPRPPGEGEGQVTSTLGPLTARGAQGRGSLS